MLKILFATSFFLFNGNIIDTKFSHHKYEKENYKKIFYLKTNESINLYCLKHSKVEIVKKLRNYTPGGGQKTQYKVTSPTK